MKTVSKFFGLIALCAAAFASCQKEQVFEEDQLSDAVEEEGTRATSGREITLMTYNIAACSRYETNSTNPNKKRIFNDIANVIKATGAQYVSLNEVRPINAVCLSAMPSISNHSSICFFF